MRYEFSFYLSLIFSILAVSAQGFSQDKKEEVVEIKIMKGVFGLPVDNPKFKDRDYKEMAGYLKGLGINMVVGVPLDKALIDELHNQGIRVYAEVVIFAGEEYWREDPKMRPINSKGEPIAKQDWYAALCPTQEKLRKEKFADIKRIIRDFAVDGIWLDFIRYPCHWEVISPLFEETCFCDSCLEKFRIDSKISFPLGLKNTKDKAEFILSHYRMKWYNWKCQQITSFVREAKRILVEKSPELELGLFAVPWRAEDFGNAIIRIIAQDFKELSFYADIFSPMLYHKMCGKDISWIDSVIRYIQDETAKKVAPILQAIDISEIELAEAMKEALSNSKDGIVIFDMAALINDRREEIIKSIFNKSESTSQQGTFQNFL